MFAISVRVSPCSARSSPRSVGRATVIDPSSCVIFIRGETCCCSSPSGPLTMTRPGSMEMLTPAGTSIGFLPIRLIQWLPDEADDLAPHATLLRGALGDEPGRRGQDRRAHPAEDAREAVLAGVDAAARLGDALQVGDDPLAAPAVLQLDDQSSEAPMVSLVFVDVVPFVRGDDTEVLDVALLLEELRDLHLQAGGRHRGRLVQRLVGVADAGEHVGYRISEHVSHSYERSDVQARPVENARHFSRRYQELLVMPGITPWWARSRRQIRQSPNFLKT